MAEVNPLTAANHTDLGNAECLETLHGGKLRFCHTRKKWLLWAGSHWKVDPNGEATRLARETARARYLAAVDIADEKARIALAKWATGSENQGRIKATLEAGQSLAALATTIDLWDADPDLLATPDGATINLAEGRARQPRQSDYLSLASGATYEPDADCPRWRQFLHEVFSGDQELIAYIQRAVGYSLTGHTHEQKLFICYGTGANGKSVFLDVLSWLAGDFHAAASFSTFDADNRNDGKNDDLAALKGKRLVTIIETDEDRRLAEARVKALTGQDAISARFLYGDFFTFRPCAKFWVAVNHRPGVHGTDNGIWRRLQLIPFRQTFTGDRLDAKLSAKLRAEAAGILNWAIEGAKLWHAHGLGACAAVDNATASYRKESDILGAWIDENCILHATLKTEAKELYSSYRLWAEVNGMRPMTSQAWGRRMGERAGLEKDRRAYWGIGLTL